MRLWRAATPFLAVSTLLSPVASADEGWRCTAEATWSLCPPTTAECTSNPVQVDRIGPVADDASRDALDACRRNVGVERLQSAFVLYPDTPPEALTRVERACEVTQCTETAFTPDPMHDAFDEPVCIQVRSFVCELCGPDSPLCDKVLTEQPVTAGACSDTHTRLQLFSDFLGQIDVLQPGAWTEARNDLCGT